MDTPGPVDPNWLELLDAGGGTRLRLRVKPGARKNALTGVHAGALKLSVVAAPEKGRANAAVLRLLAQALGVTKSAVELLSGETSQDKVVRIALPPEEVASRLSEHLPF